MDYARLCETYQAVENTSKRLEKTRAIAALLKETEDDLEAVMLLLQGRAFPAWDKQKIGVSSKITLKALALTTGTNTQDLEKAWSKKGDLGLVAEEHITGKSQQTLFSGALTIPHVHAQIKRLATIEGTGSVSTKLKIISELLSNASAQEAKYVTRTILEELRIGIASGTLRDAIIYAFLAKEAGIENGEITDREKYKAISGLVQSAYDKTNDFAKTARAAEDGIAALEEVTLVIGVPLKVMLGVKGTTVADAIEKLGTPLMLQYKYDGFRLQVHKDGEDIRVFTRRLEDVTEQFPDIIARVKEHVTADSCVLDGEAIGVDPETGKYRPFQEISQRIRRKYDIKETAEKLPVDIRLFDIMFLDGEDLLHKPLEERFSILKRVVQEHERIGLAHTLITEDPEEGQAFYDEAISVGEEGLFAKKLDSPYQPGVRVGNWIKIKSTMEPLDVVVISAEWGEGKRSGWFTSFGIAVQDETGELVEIGKVATGLKELPEEGFSFPEITELLTPLIEFEDDEEGIKRVRVKPEIVLEVGYDEIQKSPSYSSGYALRFPRILRNRTDERGREDISTSTYVEQLYETQ